VSHNDELSLFLQEVADVRPLRSDHIAPVAGNSQPTEAQLARREAATAEQLTLDHLGTEAVEMLDPHECEVRDIRCLLILHGKGERSTPRALLKSHVSAWLPQLPSVMAMHSAERRHGGSGALYVLLRKSERKKAENRERHQKRLG